MTHWLKRSVGLALAAAATLGTTARAHAQSALPVTGVRMLDIKRLPTVQWQRFPEFSPWDFRAPKVIPQDGPAFAELALVRRPVKRVQITFSPNWQGQIFHSGSASDQEPVLPGRHGGAFDVCAKEGAMIRPLRFHGVQGRADGALDYLRGFAWFDGHHCTVHGVRRRHARAVPIMEDVFAFFSRCDDCDKDKRELLHVIRSSNHEDVRLKRKPGDKSPDAFVYDHSTASVAPGSSDRIIVSLKQRESKSPPKKLIQAVFEVQRGKADKTPSILIYRRTLPRE